ncbi:MAG: hypothetical protein IPK76_22065 [Lewinellaceae bacterium]|nr:hypothetical protein [Lewinellaceae bacterium]
MVLLKNDGGILPLTPSSPFNYHRRPLMPTAAAIKTSMSFWTLGLGSVEEYDTTKVVTPAMTLKSKLEEMGFEVTITEICLDAACNEKDLSVAAKATTFV